MDDLEYEVYRRLRAPAETPMLDCGGAGDRLGDARRRAVLAPLSLDAWCDYIFRVEVPVAVSGPATPAAVRAWYDYRKTRVWPY